MEKKEFLEELKSLLEMAQSDVNVDYKIWPDERYSIIIETFEFLLNNVDRELDCERKRDDGDALQNH